jgi:RPA family protein
MTFIIRILIMKKVADESIPSALIPSANKVARVFVKGKVIFKELSDLDEKG